jgi:hypothetical protein
MRFPEMDAARPRRKLSSNINGCVTLRCRLSGVVRQRPAVCGAKLIKLHAKCVASDEYDETEALKLRRVMITQKMRRNYAVAA